ncbi:MAG: hemerythrin domain-containing protein [Labilithrix sp.]|nr:hemerythrin domain-containing protein [Labilithrix sp.]MBX3212477.1 hemerythrin domain-containing protein [Labilithrix sp.]
MSSLIAKIEVRQRISTDHALLRGLCRALIAVARAAERDERHRPAIRDVLGHLCAEVDRHFEYEEEVIVPLLREVDAWGPVRVERLYRDHAEQRSVLVALVEDAEDGMRNVEDLADEIVWFFQRFEQDMAAEEERLLSAEDIGAEPMVDQIDG